MSHFDSIEFVVVDEPVCYPVPAAESKDALESEPVQPVVGHGYETVVGHGYDSVPQKELGDDPVDEETGLLTTKSDSDD